MKWSVFAGQNCCVCTFGKAHQMASRHNKNGRINHFHERLGEVKENFLKGHALQQHGKDQKSWECRKQRGSGLWEDKKKKEKLAVVLLVGWQRAREIHLQQGPRSAELVILEALEKYGVKSAARRLPRQRRRPKKQHQRASDWRESVTFKQALYPYRVGQDMHNPSKMHMNFPSSNSSRLNSSQWISHEYCMDCIAGASDWIRAGKENASDALEETIALHRIGSDWIWMQNPPARKIQNERTHN